MRATCTVIDAILDPEKTPGTSLPHLEGKLVGDPLEKAALHVRSPPPPSFCLPSRHATFVYPVFFPLTLDCGSARGPLS